MLVMKLISRRSKESVMSGFLNKHPELRAGIYHGIPSDKEWADDYSAPESFHEERLIHTSAQGSMMRSKNEVYIASRLDHYGIPYRYEAPIAHPDVTRIPDFTIKRPRDGKIIYWEHLGMPENEAYMQDNERKLVEYRDAGITPWNHLIITYDMGGGNIDAKLIDAMIQGWLI